MLTLILLYLALWRVHDIKFAKNAQVAFLSVRTEQLENTERILNFKCRSSFIFAAISLTKCLSGRKILPENYI
jgi:hypothetical protein